MSESDLLPTPRRHPTVPWGTLFCRALRLKCPRCGQGNMFSGPFTTLERCPHCHLKYERDPGYFLGSIYINYGLTGISIIILYSVLHIGFRWTNTQLALPLAGFCCVFPALAFRHTRALWLAMDCHWDESLMEVDDEPVPAVTPPPGDSSEFEYLTYDDALVLAKMEAIRDLHQTPYLITFVRYCSDFDDFCRVHIRFDTPDGGVYEIRLLPLSERLEAEMVDDGKIETVAKSGRRLNAVRLHRLLHGTTLAEAVAAISNMEADC